MPDVPSAEAELPPDGLDIEDPAALRAYLCATGRIGRDEQIVMHVLAGGVSNRTVRVERNSGEAWVIKQALPKLRVAVDWFSSPERIHREAEGLRWLARAAPPGSVPGFIFEDFDRHLLAMEAVPLPHENWKTLLLGGRLDLEHVSEFGRLLGTIHRAGWDERALTRTAFQDASFFESLRIEPYYTYTAAQVPAAASFLTDLIAETREVRLTLVHGDYSPKNILVHRGRLVLLDHEVIHFGDPAFDLGFSLAHLLSKAHHLPPLRSRFAQAARCYWRAYRETLGAVPWADELEGRSVRHTLACLLARVRGRSPLEYLDAGERARQCDAVLGLISDAPGSVAALTGTFVERLQPDVYDRGAPRPRNSG